ncbi:MAG TPA: DUF2267 domain-containing protein [Hyphomicrobiaceae bacterium]|nr:MAG: DUF2267 domain-containing protein [Pseudomonadota bacterium]HEX5600307.1 DUF2267 domain-containing protein [Hyphomicrobiaceae bacterium]
MTLPSTIAHAVQQTQEWLKELRDNGGLASEAEAYAVLRAVLHQLRDRLTLAEAVDLGQQLPLIIRGIYYEGWRPSHAPEKIRTKQKFLDQVTMRLLPHQIPPEPAVRDVFALLAHHLDPGEIADVIDQLPAEIKELWPETARTFRARGGG